MEGSWQDDCNSLFEDKTNVRVMVIESHFNFVPFWPLSLVCHAQTWSNNVFQFSIIQSNLTTIEINITRNETQILRLSLENGSKSLLKSSVPVCSKNCRK